MSQSHKHNPKSPNGQTMSLDMRIAATLVSDDVPDKTELQALLAEAEQAYTQARATIERETSNALSYKNPDPDASDELLRKAKRSVARLDQSIPELRNRIASLEQFEYNQNQAARKQNWHARMDDLEARRDSLAQDLKETYCAALKDFTQLFDWIDRVDNAISELHLRAPSGETRRLIGTECKARGLDHFDAMHPPLRENLRLPHFDLSRDIAVPVPVRNERAMLMEEAIQKRMAEKYALIASQNWGAAQELQIAQEREAMAKREAEIKAEEAKARADYERRLRESGK